MDVKKVWETKRGKWALVILLVIIVLVILAFYINSVSGKRCGDYSCFQVEMSACSRARYTSEMPEASWGYTVLGSSDGNCDVNVKLLQAKNGTLEMNTLEGYDMVCSYPLGIAAYPEKDLSKCHGRLKEELQGLIIKKLYSYIVDNVGQIATNLENGL
jgi:hypothetical protein